MRKRELRYYQLCDMLSAIIVWMLFYIFRRVANDLAVPSAAEQPLIDPSFPLLFSLLFYTACAMGIHYLSGYYNASFQRSRIKELFTTLADAFFIAVIAFFAMLLDDSVYSYHFYYKLLLLLWALQFGVTYLFRIIITQAYFRTIRLGKHPNNTLIIGSGEVAQRASESIGESMRSYGVVFKGFISFNNKQEVDPCYVLGTIDDVEQVIANYDIHTVIIALKESDKEVIFKIINKLIPLNVSIYSIPGQLEIVTGSVKLDAVDADPLVSLTSPAMPPWQQSMKRLFDMLSSLLLLIIFSPLFLFVYLKIRASRIGSTIYSQERIGLHGKPFRIYKFRTMYQDAELSGPQLSSTHDSRITPFGRYLRKYRIDELPQLWNILRGDMSVVGPRPERQFFIDQITEVAPYYCLIYKIQPGLLSWGPIRVGYTDNLDKMVQRLNYDIIYMESMSLLTDLKIMIYSIEVIIRGKGV